GESVTEGTIGKWLKQPGDKVNKYDLLVEGQTDKVNTEIPSPVAGTLKEVKGEEGQTGPIGTPLSISDTADGATAAQPPGAGTASISPRSTGPGSVGASRARMSRTSSRSANRHSSRPRPALFRHSRRRRRKRSPHVRLPCRRSPVTSSFRSPRCGARSRTTWSRPGAHLTRTPSSMST